jgi:hypothetical protein
MRSSVSTERTKRQSRCELTSPFSLLRRQSSLSLSLFIAARTMIFFIRLRMTQGNPAARISQSVKQGRSISSALYIVEMPRSSLGCKPTVLIILLDFLTSSRQIAKQIPSTLLSNHNYFHPNSDVTIRTSLINQTEVNTLEQYKLHNSNIR